MTSFGDAFKPCSHPRTEEIRNGNGACLGRQCRTCLALLSAVADCSGCARKATAVRARVADRFYCNDECKKAGESALAKKRRVSPPPSAQVEWAWARKDKR